MNARRAAEIQAVLEGIPLPARRQALIEYGSRYDQAVAADLEGLPNS